MSIYSIIVLAFALAMDAFAVAAAAGIKLEKLTFRTVFRLSWHFGFFQFMMPVIGWAAGITIERFISSYDHWVAFGLLVLIGIKMIYESFLPNVDSDKKDMTKGWKLILLSIATSIDALAAGLSIAILDVNIWLPAIIIGIVAAAMTIAGMFLGRTLGQIFGKRMELVGGFILILIGLKILIDHFI